MKKWKRIFFALILGISMIATTGCTSSDDSNDSSTNDPNSDTQSGTGTLALNLSDAPIDAANVSGVFITITSIQYNRDGSWEEMPDFEGPQSHNLLELSGGNSTLLGNLNLPSGSYTQIRFMLDVAEQGGSSANPGCYIEFTDGTQEGLFAPSGGQSGYKANGNFDVPINGTVTVTADFDVRKAVVSAGKSGKYILKPTIRLVVNDQAGNIAGSVTDSTTDRDLVVFAYENDGWTDTEDDDPATSESRFPTAVTSAAVDASGDYVLPFLAAGIYDLTIASYTDGEYAETLGFIADVSVDAAGTTTQDIDTADLSEIP